MKILAKVEVCGQFSRQTDKPKPHAPDHYTKGENKGVYSILFEKYSADVVFHYFQH